MHEFRHESGIVENQGLASSCSFSLPVPHAQAYDGEWF